MRVGSMRDDAVLALTGCGGGGATNDKDAKEAFIGSWKLAGMVSDGEEAPAEDIAMLDAFGMGVGLNVNEDGTCALIMFGEPIDGTWRRRAPQRPSSPSTAVPSLRPLPTASCR